MYKIKNIVYSEPGKILVKEGMKGYQFEGELDDFEEIAIDLSNIVADTKTGVVIYDGIVQAYNQEDDYAKLKADMVKRRYTPDDQFAIILNKEEDQLAYDRMQQWREWSSRVSHAILDALEPNTTE